MQRETGEDNERIQDGHNNDKGGHCPAKSSIACILDLLGLEIGWEACGVH